MTNIDEIVKALRCCDAHCETCQFGDKERAYTCTVTGSAADAIEALQSELQPFIDAAAEYGIDAKTMLTLAKSQIKTAEENISLRAERDQARLDCAIAERNHMNTLARLLDAQERITELTAERDALLKAVEKPCVQERGD